jgi:hypothetical protein
MSTFWIRRLLPPKPAPVRPTRRTAPLALRPLEDRVVPSFDTPLQNFDSSAFSGVSPPDPNGAVGLTQYVSMYNGPSTVINVYDKTTGAPVSGFQDRPIESLSVTNVGTGAPVAGFGDPIVAYDHFNNRWVVGELTGRGNGNGLTLYVSKTSDATGGWFHYEIATPGFPDYPKLSVTQDGYFLATNEGDVSPVYALNAAKMIAGQPLGASDFQRQAAPVLAGHGFQVTTPADVDGPAGPAGTSYFMRKNDDEINAPAETPPQTPDPTHDFLEVWAYHVDFANPANTTYTQVANLPVSEFDSLFNNPDTFSAIPQPGGGPDLDPINEPIMNRLTYRNFGSYEAMVGCYVTDLDPTSKVRAGIRWFELRRTGGGAWTEFQDGLVDSNDGLSRWMGAIAMDANGNIAMGYSVAGTTSPGGQSVFPGLRYTGRLATDPLGTMPQGEFTLTSGTGFAGSASNTRWGDYFAMSVDPTNDNQFWFTGEYGLSNHDWQTRVAELAFDVTPPAPVSTTIARDPAQPATTNTGPIRFDVTFGEPVSGFTASDVQFTPGTLTTGLAATVTQNGPNGDSYFVDVAGMNGVGTVGIAVPDGAAASVATGGATLAATTPPADLVSFDNVAPVPTLSPSSVGLTRFPTTPVTVTFSEPVTFDPSKLQVVNATVQNFATVNPTKYTFNLVAAGDGAFSVTLPAVVLPA